MRIEITEKNSTSVPLYCKSLPHYLQEPAQQHAPHRRQEKRHPPTHQQVLLSLITHLPQIAISQPQTCQFHHHPTPRERSCGCPQTDTHWNASTFLFATCNPPVPLVWSLFPPLQAPPTNPTLCLFVVVGILVGFFSSLCLVFCAPFSLLVNTYIYTYIQDIQETGG